MKLIWAALVAMVMTTLVMAKKLTPPEIQVPQGNRWNKNPTYIREFNPEQIHCHADGNPTPTYEWKLQNPRTQLWEEVNSPGVTYNKNNGTLTALASFTYSNNGNYTCVASNINGAAMTPPIALVLADMSNFAGDQDQPPVDVAASVSEKLSLECKNVKMLRSLPAAEIKWQRGQRVGSELVFKEIEITSNKAIDPEGTLHFLWLNTEDFGYIYVCSAFNRVTLLSSRNTHSYNLKQVFGSPKDRGPSQAYWADVTAMADTQAKLVCIFSYFSEKNLQIDIQWIHGGVEVGKGTELNVLAKVPTTTQDVTGEYMCVAKVGEQRRDGYVRLTVVSPPYFEAGNKPRRINVPSGNDAVFRCDADTYKTLADVPKWYRNAQLLPVCQGPNEMVCPEKKQNGDIKCAEKCNSFPDCDNGEDENGCSNQCSENKRLCQGKCIGQDEACDEKPCSWPYVKMCKSDEVCIHKDKKCDGQKDCVDNSDEEYCPGGDGIEVENFHLSSDMKVLTFKQVTPKDQLCIQCSVSNQYGTTWGEGCITVIDRIKVLREPNSTYNVEPGMYLNIGVDATTDTMYQNQMKYEWIMYNDTTDAEGNPTKEAVKLNQVLFTQYFQTSQSGKNLTIIIPDLDEERDSQQKKYEAYMYITNEKQYAVVISHPDESVTVNFTVIGVEVKPPAPKPVVEKASLNLWFIALILAVLILFVVIALIVCYMYRNRGGTYPLDKKEHQAGHDPAQELKDNAFHDVGRVDDEYDDDKPRADEVSLSESVKPYESDEDITAEYGEDLDLSKFNEEGSFIFQYGDKKSRAKEATV